MSYVRLSSCMLISHKNHNNAIQVYSVTVMTHGKALQAGQSGQGTSEPITPVFTLRQVEGCLREKIFVSWRDILGHIFFLLCG